MGRAGIRQGGVTRAAQVWVSRFCVLVLCSGLCMGGKGLRDAQRVARVLGRARSLACVLSKVANRLRGPKPMSPSLHVSHGRHAQVLQQPLLHPGTGGMPWYNTQCGQRPGPPTYHGLDPYTQPPVLVPSAGPARKGCDDDGAPSAPPSKG